MRETNVLAKRALFAVLLTGFLVAPVHSLDFGGNVNSRTSLENTTAGFRNSLSVFVRQNPETSPDGTVRWVAEGSVTAVTTEVDGNGFSTDWIPDINLMRIEAVMPGLLGRPQSVFRATGGRFALSEPTGLVFADRVDGIRVGLDFPRISVTAGGGYTGLIAGANSGIAISADDGIARDDPDEYAGARRAVATVNLTVPQLIGVQSLRGGGLVQFDMRDEYEAEKVNSQYVYMQLDGRLAGNLYTEAAAAASYVQRSLVDIDDEVLLDPETTVGVAGRLQTRMYFGDHDDTVFTGRARYASGDHGPLGAFTPATAAAVQLLGPAQLSDVVLFKLDVAHRPFAGRPGARARSLELSGYAAADFPGDFGGGAFRGLESGGRVTLRFLSDLGARIWAGAYIPGDEDADMQFLGRLDVSTSF